MIKETYIYWEMTAVVKETTKAEDVEELLKKHFSTDFNYNIYETSKDEVLQIYNDEICYTIIGGSSADKWEWKSNFNWLPLQSGYIHNGFYKLAKEVVSHTMFIERQTMVAVGHSRGGAGASVLCDQYGYKGVGFGVPKAFSRKVDIDFVNIRNPKDPVVHVVPFFRTAGKVIEYKYTIHPHTQYGKHIKKGDRIDV